MPSTIIHTMLNPILT